MVNLIVNPTEKQLDEVKSWLIQEQQELNAGFFCNWDNIENSFYKSELLVFEINSMVVGFLSWTAFDLYISIDIMEIHPHFRKRGLGQAFFNKVDEYFKGQNFKAIKLFCAPEVSERFWKKMNFIKFPNRGYSDPELSYYKPLFEANIPTTKVFKNKLELWSLEPYEIKGHVPNWTWEIRENSKNILQPCNPNWNLRLTIEGKVVAEDKVKYFPKDKEILFSPFLYYENTTSK